MIPGLAVGGAEGQAEDFPTDGDEPAPPTPGVQVGGIIAASRGMAEATVAQFAELTERGMVLSPPYIPTDLVAHCEQSHVLPALIDAMAVNISGHGVDYPALFPKHEEDGASMDPPEGSDAELAALKFWVETSSLAEVADLVDRDRETVGWGCFEVMRDGDGRPAAVSHLPAFQIRLGPQSEPILCTVPARDPTTGEIRSIKRWKRFRRFVQIRNDGSIRYFKEFGDPRRLNMRTGEYKGVRLTVTGEPKPVAPWRTSTGRSLEAGELVYTRIYCPYSPYGVPRWVGAAGAVSAARRAVVLLNLWFEAAPIGTKILAVAGGSFGQNVMKRLSLKIDAEARGDIAPWAIYTVEADASAVDAGADVTRPAPPRLAIEDMSAPLPPELFAGPDSLIEMCSKWIRTPFRLPSVYTGESEDWSYAASVTARACGEEQVLGPAREKNWHRWFASELLPALGIRWYGLTFRPSVTNDDVAAAGPAAALSAEGGATPNMLRLFTSRLLKIDPPPEIAEEWANRPMAITLALLGAGQDPNAPLGAAEPVAGDAAAAEPVLDADGNPVPGGQAPVEGEGGMLPGGTSVQDTALNGTQIASLLEIQRAVAEGWLPKETAADTIRVALRIPGPDATLLVDAIEEGIAEPPPPVAPGAGGAFGGGKPGKGPPGPGAGVVGKPKGGKGPVSKRALDALELLRSLEIAMHLQEVEAARLALDPGAIAPQL